MKLKIPSFLSPKGSKFGQNIITFNLNFIVSKVKSNAHYLQPVSHREKMSISIALTLQKYVTILSIMIITTIISKLHSKYIFKPYGNSNIPLPF